MLLAKTATAKKAEANREQAALREKEDAQALARAARMGKMDAHSYAAEARADAGNVRGSFA